MARDRAGDQSQRGSLTSLSDRFRNRSDDQEQQPEEHTAYRRNPEPAPEPAAEPQQPAQPQPQRQTPRAAQPRPSEASVIDAHSTFDGRFETGQDLRIEGTISGEVICRGALYIERNAVARVKRVEAREVHVFGTLEGEIECSEKLVLAETANISGTIRAGTLIVHEGAIFNGTVETGATTGESPSRQRPARKNPKAEAEPRGEPSFSLSSLDAEESQSAS